MRKQVHDRRAAQAQGSRADPQFQKLLPVSPFKSRNDEDNLGAVLKSSGPQRASTPRRSRKKNFSGNAKYSCSKRYGVKLRVGYGSIPSSSAKPMGRSASGTSSMGRWTEARTRDRAGRWTGSCCTAARTTYAPARVRHPDKSEVCSSPGLRISPEASSSDALEARPRRRETLGEDPAGRARSTALPPLAAARMVSRDSVAGTELARCRRFHRTRIQNRVFGNLLRCFRQLLVGQCKLGHRHGWKGPRVVRINDV